MARSLTVLLRGGPDDLPQVWGRHPAGGTGDPVKVPVRNGFEHFESAQEYAGSQGDPTPVRSWVYRTAIAE